MTESEGGHHDVWIRYLGLVPFAICETCGWEGPSRDKEREATDDARAHRRVPG